MVQIAPSILSADFANLERDCRKVVTKNSPLLHIDVMDGVFVPNISIGAPVLKALLKVLPQAIYDVRLVIADPYRYIKDFAKAGANHITFYIETTDNAVELAQKIHDCGCSAAISLCPGTSLQTLRDILPFIDMVLIMSVQPGFGGQSFLPDSIDRIRRFRQMAGKIGKEILIEVDGGINKKTAPLCTEAGADILVAGNAIFGANNLANALQELLLLTWG